MIADPSLLINSRIVKTFTSLLLQGWEYSAVMFVLVNALALVFITYAYCRMISEIRTSGIACRSTQQSRERDKVAQRFAVIVFTDCACWFPIIIVKLAALAGKFMGKNLVCYSDEQITYTRLSHSYFYLLGSLQREEMYLYEICSHFND